MLFADALPPPAIVQSVPYEHRIRLNTVGFLPEGPKQATIGAPCTEFQVVRVADGEIVFRGSAGPVIQTERADTNEKVQVIDFSAFKTPGLYRVEIPGVGRSADFAVAGNVWNEPYEVVTRAMYLWRCGTEVKTTWHGHTWSHAACHLEDGWLDQLGGEHVRLAATGGWHDAGDYNKYIVNAGVSIGLMLKAWEHYPDRIANLSIDIPESSNKVPDLLDEVRWEAEWAFTQQAEDGRVCHKLSQLDFKYWGPPEKDSAPRFFSPWSTAATASFVGIMAETSRAWRPYDPIFAEKCLAAARRSWRFLNQHPEEVMADLHAFRTGTYQTKDFTYRLWAAAELWETTNEPEFLKAFEKRAAEAGGAFDIMGPGWTDVRDLAFATYLRTAHPAGRNPELVERLSKDLLEKANAIVASSQKNGYARPLGGEARAWFWGCNGAVASQTFVLQLAYLTKPDEKYRTTALHALDHLFGRNFQGRSYVTGLGANPPEHPHDRRGEPAWPGYLVGGSATDGRGWEDASTNFRVNEIAINWNAALIYATAAFVDPAATAK